MNKKGTCYKSQKIYATDEKYEYKREEKTYRQHLMQGIPLQKTKKTKTKTEVTHGGCKNATSEQSTPETQIEKVEFRYLNWK